MRITNLPERIQSKVMPSPSGCWLWSGCIADGYGKAYWNGTSACAHRVTYELLVGEIPDGLQIDHLCRVRSCVNPAHLEAVTHAENVRRGDTGKETGRQNLAKPACPQGHPYSGDNLYVNPGTGHRHCKACRRDYRARYNARQKR